LIVTYESEVQNIKQKKNTSVGNNETSNDCLEVSWLMAIIALRPQAGEGPDDRRRARGAIDVNSSSWFCLAQATFCITVLQFT